MSTYGARTITYFHFYITYQVYLFLKFHINIKFNIKLHILNFWSHLYWIFLSITASTVIKDDDDSLNKQNQTILL